MAAHAQPVTRLKAKLVAFDGKVMTLQGDAKDPLTVSVTPESRFVQSSKADLGTLKEGDYAGAAVIQDRNGALKAQDVYLYAPALKGTGEGRFPDRDRLMVNGTVSKVEAGAVTLHYRGAVVSPAGKGRTICEGRANPLGYASALACSADAVIAVSPTTPVSALTVGDASLLVPGALVTVSLVKLADGGAVAPGVIVEKPLPVAVEKAAPTP